jgi:hypothetical protein
VARDNLSNGAGDSYSGPRSDGYAFYVTSLRNLACVAAAIVGSFLAFGKLNDDGSPEPALRATGVGVLALGVGIDLALLPSIFPKERSEEAFAYPP